LSVIYTRNNTFFSQIIINSLGNRRSLERTPCIDLSDDDLDEIQKYETIIKTSMDDVQQLIKQVQNELELIKLENIDAKMYLTSSEVSAHAYIDLHPHPPSIPPFPTILILLIRFQMMNGYH
jgi:hypothetical protein